MVSDGQGTRNAGFSLEMGSSVEGEGCSSSRSWVHGGDKLASSWAGPMGRTRPNRQTKPHSTGLQHNVQQALDTAAGLLKLCLPDGSRHPGMPEYKDVGLLKLTWTSSWKGTSATVPMGSMRASTAGRT